MLGNLTGIHLLIILGIVILLFGATKLPALAKGLGQSINIFKKEMGDDKKRTDDGAVNTVVHDGATQQSAQPAAQAQPVVNPGPSVQPNVHSTVDPKN